MLWESDSVNVTDIAYQLHSESLTITSLLKKLEFSGFVTRERNKLDVRIVNIFLTKLGIKIQVTVANMHKVLHAKLGCQMSNL